MGLDITAYSHLNPVGAHADSWCDNDDHTRAFVYDCFPQSFRGIPVLSTETIGSSDFLIGGCYEPTDRTETLDFHAGPYHGYGAWRDDLRRQFNPDKHPDQPFYELVFFADNEGCIGPDAASDLYADFREYADRYKPAPDDWPVQPWYRGRYDDWMQACKLAADGGLIHFH